MQSMTARERVGNLLKRKPVDRASFHEAIWGETSKRWIKEGHLKEKDIVPVVFTSKLGMEIEGAGWFNSEAKLDNPNTIVEEDEETKLVRNGNGALLRYWKNKSGTPEHVDFL